MVVLKVIHLCPLTLQRHGKLWIKFNNVLSTFEHSKWFLHDVETLKCARFVKSVHQSTLGGGPKLASLSEEGGRNNPD